MALPLEHLMLNFATALLLAVAVPHVSRASCIIQATNPSTLQPFNPSTLSYTYDRLGHMLSATVSGVSTNYYAYSIHGQLTDEVQNGVSLARTYDSLNRPTGYSLHEEETLRTSRTLREINYSYDTLGRFSGVGFNAEAQRSRGDFEYSYLPGTDLVSGYTSGSFSRSVTYEPNRTLIAAITNSFTPAGETYHLPLSTYHYSNDSLGRRTAITRGGAAFGDLAGVTDAYGYNLRSEVVFSRRTLDGAEVRGFDYDYAYDPIGNRISATDYDEQGNALVSSYSANVLNQYTQRTVPGYAAIRGEAATNATVTVNERPTFRQGAYFYGGDMADNAASNLWKELEIYAAINPPGTNTPDVVYASTGTVFVARTPETFTYDADGNMTSDGRFHYFWNGENRLVMASNDTFVVTYAYDHRGRMVTKTLCASAPLRLIKTTTYIWDNWNIIREIVREGDSVAITDNFWGLDIDGTPQGAGGVGGLLTVVRHNSSTPNSPTPQLYFPTYDANGNVSEYISTNGEIVAHYDYSPFGEPLVASGPLASTFSHQFSTKPYCAVTGLYEYQVRRYRPEIGRELNIPLQTALLSSLSQSPLHSESALSKSVGSTTEAHSKYATTYFKYSLIFIDNRTCCRGCAGGWAIVPTDIHVKYKVDRSHRLYQQVVEHEKHHMKDAEMKSLVFGEIAAILTGECEREECYQAKQQLIKSAINVEIAQYDFDQARFDCFDELGSVLRCSEMPNLLAKLQMEGATWKRWIEKVERVCAK